MHRPRRRARDRGFAFGILAAALRDRGLHHAAARGAAVHDVEMALVGEQFQVAPDGLVRARRHVGQLADADRPSGPQAFTISL